MITVVGNKPVMRRGDNEIGVVGDNLVKTLEFSIDRIQGAIDLNDYSAWALIERSAPNGGASYSTMVTKSTVGDKITISLPITANETKDYGYIYSSIKFAEDEESLPIWQTQRILLKIAKGINGETEAEALETNIFDAQVAAFQAAIDVLDLTNYEHTDNKITSISSSSTDGEYPSGKAVWAKVKDFSSTSLNTYLGYASGVGSSSQYSVGVGAYALNSLTSGTSNTSVGARSLRANTTGYRNTAIGRGALSDNVTGFDNVAVGAFALELSNSTIGCIGIGSYALNKNTTYWNTAVGHNSLMYNTSGYQNSGFGGYALGECTTGVNNTGVGYYSLNANTTGIANTVLGAYSLYRAVGSYNTVVGSEAAFSTTTSNDCVYIGYRCQALQDATENEIVIGSRANGAGTNTVTLGNTSIVSTVLRGDVKIGTKITASNGTDPAVGITATAGDSSTKLATTAFVQGEIAGIFGEGTTAIGENSSAFGYETLASGDAATANGYKTTASGNFATANGYETTASGEAATANGYGTLASARAATANGYGTTASGYAATANGSDTTASGYAATANGSDTTASGYAATANGISTTASSNGATANGYGTTASGNAATANGYGTTASGNAATANGYDTTASGTAAASFGNYTDAKHDNSTIVGKFGETDTDTLFAVANGTSVDDKSLALNVESDKATWTIDVFGVTQAAGDNSGKFATTEYVMGSRGSAAVKLVQDSYNILESDEIVFCDGGLNPMYTVALPHSAVGKKYTIKSVDAGITINPYVDETIDGEDNITIDGGTAIEIVCYSSGKWAIISRYTP